MADAREIEAQIRKRYDVVPPMLQPWLELLYACEKLASSSTDNSARADFEMARANVYEVVRWG